MKAQLSQKVAITFALMAIVLFTQPVLAETPSSYGWYEINVPSVILIGDEAEASFEFFQPENSYFRCGITNQGGEQEWTLKPRLIYGGANVYVEKVTFKLSELGPHRITCWLYPVEGGPSSGVFRDFRVTNGEIFIPMIYTN